MAEASLGTGRGRYDRWLMGLEADLALDGVSARDEVVGDKPSSQRRDVGHPALSQVGDGLELDHVGIAVRSIEGARGFYEGLGAVIEGVETVPHEGVRVAMIALGGSRIELLEALSPDTVIGRFVAKRGEGMHHVALRVAGIDALLARLMGQGVRLVRDAVRVGAGGHRYFFVHPESTGGVLMEIVEKGN
jgi:LAO/AO transport system kinase